MMVGFVAVDYWLSASNEMSSSSKIEPDALHRDGHPDAIVCPFHRFGCNSTAASERLINEHKMESVRMPKRRSFYLRNHVTKVNHCAVTRFAGSPASPASAASVCIRVIKGVVAIKAICFCLGHSSE